MRKYPIDLQDDETSSAVCCIAMILKYYGFLEEIDSIKENTRFTHSKMTTQEMVDCLKKYQIESKVSKFNIKQGKNGTILPCILYTLKENKSHFMVLYEVKKGKYIIGDPAQGILKISKEELESMCEDVVLIQHIGRIRDIYYQSYKEFFKNTLLSYKKEFFELLKKGFLMAILSYMSGLLIMFMIDYKRETQMIYLILFSYGIIEIVKRVLKKSKEIQLIYFQKTLNQDNVFYSSWNVYSQQPLLLEGNEGIKQDQLLSFFKLGEMSIFLCELICFDGLFLLVSFIGMPFLSVLMSGIVLCMIMSIGFYLYISLNRMQKINKDMIESRYAYHQHLFALMKKQFIIQRFHLYQKEREQSFDVFFKDSYHKEQYYLKVEQMKYRVSLIMIVFYTFILGVGCFCFRYNRMTLGTLFMFGFSLFLCVKPIMNIVIYFNQYKQTRFIYEKFKGFIKQKVGNKVEVQEKVKTITLDNVGYLYGFKKVLFEHLDYTFDKNILIQGYVGSGKSSLLKLLMGIDCHYEGDIYYNQQELRTIERASLYKHIGYECETPLFLERTLYENFLCEDKDLIKRYLHLFKQSQLIDLFDVELNENGYPLSLGQRQIVALIRLLVQKYDVYILDEALSHVDVRLAKRIIQYLLDQVHDAFFIIVSHQIKRVKKNCDYAIISEGKLKIKEGRK